MPFFKRTSKGRKDARSAPSQNASAVQDRSGGDASFRKISRKEIVEVPFAPPNLDPEEIGKRAKKTGLKIAKKNAIITFLAAFGVVVPSEAVALALLCCFPIALTATAFVRSRLNRDKWAGLFGLGALSMIVAALLVILRGMYVSSEPMTRMASLAAQISTGIPSALWVGLFSGNVPGVPFLHCVVAAFMATAGVVCIRLQIANYHLSRPSRPANFRSAQRLKPRRASRLPRKVIN